MASRRINRTLIRWGLRGLILLLAAVTLLVGVAAWSAYQKERVSRQELRATEAEHRALGERATALEAALHALETPRGIEATIRERYPVVRPGEEVITLVSGRPGTTPSPPADPSIWNSIKSWLGL